MAVIPFQKPPSLDFFPLDGFNFMGGAPFTPLCIVGSS